MLWLTKRDVVRAQIRAQRFIRYYKAGLRMQVVEQVWQGPQGKRQVERPRAVA